MHNHAKNGFSIGKSQFHGRYRYFHQGLMQASAFEYTGGRKSCVVQNDFLAVL